MLSPDVRPNRLQRAKLAIADFVRTHGRGRVGLVAFAGSAFLQCPLTLDYDAFENALEAVDEKTIPVPGTDIGRALQEANRAMEKKSRRKLVVLLTTMRLKTRWWPWMKKPFRFRARTLAGLCRRRTARWKRRAGASSWCC